ncbi:MAG: Rho termination factor N-terminal domain-containing protein [Candidatus Hermodarchaeota archaeon]
MTEIETFMVYELDDSGERIKLNVEQENLQENLHPEQVLVIVREDLRRIFIWKGPTSPVRKRFISSRVASALQEELMKDARYHRCKIVSVDAGDEPSEFLNAFRIESMEVTERLEDMRYVRNIERERGVQATISDVALETSGTQVEEEYFSPALQDTSSKVVASSYSRNTPSPKTTSSMVKPSRVSKAIGLSDEQSKSIRDKILKTEISDNYKRLNLILGHTLFAAVSKTANVFGKDVVETEWEPVKKVPKDMIELDNHVLRIYFDEKKGIVEAVEILENLISTSKTTTTKTTKSSPSASSKLDTTPDFNSMTVKDLKAYAEENNIELQSNLRKADIIEILKKSIVKRPRRNLPEIPKFD